MNSARIELQRSFVVNQARVVVVVVDEVGAPEIMGVLNFPNRVTAFVCCDASACSCSGGR